MEQCYHSHNQLKITFLFQDEYGSVIIITKNIN